VAEQQLAEIVSERCAESKLKGSDRSAQGAGLRPVQCAAADKRHTEKKPPENAAEEFGENVLIVNAEETPTEAPSSERTE